MFPSKSATYAVLAVVEIARRQKGGGAMQAGEIAAHFDLPAAYAAKVLTQLVRAGVLRSDRGPRGGFRLLGPPETIDFLQIVEAVDGVFEAGSRSETVPHASKTLEGVVEVFRRVVDESRALLERQSVADFIARYEEPQPESAPAEATGGGHV
ncbi:MAG: Rrf2 family transcriptional regulator [Planctomycetes bacterium]|nr:Rrf2 family transcriptional regulator [Planctomycetota bacterium]